MLRKIQIGCVGLLLLAGRGVGALAAQISAQAQPTAPLSADPLFPLSFDATQKRQDLKAGQEKTLFTFALTNTSSSPVVIKQVTSSCGCTTISLPSQPWTLAPGDNGKIQVDVDLRNKWGMLAKNITLDTTAGSKQLVLLINIPAPSNAQPETTPDINLNRQRNIMVSLNDRQAVFKGDCARCHVEPAQGKLGKELYAAACGICHEGTHRAGMVPDLHALKHPTTYEYWKFWTSNGKTNSLMPAFAKEQGGPLTPEQIHSVAAYLSKSVVGDPKTLLSPRAQTPPAKPEPSTSGTKKP